MDPHSQTFIFLDFYFCFVNFENLSSNLLLAVSKIIPGNNWLNYRTDINARTSKRIG